MIRLCAVGMRWQYLRRRVVWPTLVVAGAATATGCNNQDCAGVGGGYSPPTDTTVAIHGSIVLAAGTGGSCNGGPIVADALTHWQVTDSAIVSVIVLDSLHAQINGLALGTTSVVASADGFGPATTLVTVR
jgi:hypothetical protein